MSSIVEDSTKGLLPELSPQHLDMIRRHFKNAMEIQCLELLQDRNAGQKAKISRRMMGSMMPNPSPSPLAMVTPAPKEPKFFPRDHDCSATFKKQEPCPGGVMGPTPSSEPDRGTPAAQIAAVLSPQPSHSKISETSEAEAPEQLPMLQNPPSSSEKQSRPYGRSVFLSDHSFQPMFPEGDLSSTTDDLAWAEIDNLDFEHTSPWSHHSFQDFGNNSDKQLD